MTQTLDLPPSAASLALSLRDLGYSLESAVADIIDNSITAQATQIDIICDLSLAEPALTILDNGTGMDREELILALRHGAKGPKADRSPSDLGRFGLGLKTASFSQGRRLTVASRRESEVVAAEWDLDKVVDQDRWLIELLSDQDIELIPHVDRLKSRGTLVTWRALDRLFEDEQGTHRENVVNEKLSTLRDHLSLVFHRFLDGDAPTGKITITVNGHPLAAFDPFCRSNKATQRLPKEVVIVNGQRVEIQAFILPHHTRLSAREYDFYRTRSDFISNQGAYVYRNCRLMAWGDWFRLVPKGEATKLGRVQIDFPSALDESWTIDIKKSRARPPRIVRDHLRQILQKITGAAVRVHRGRGQRLHDEAESPIWERYADQGKIRYTVSRSHPIIVQLFSQLDDLGRKNFTALLEAIPASLPIDLIYSDYSSDPKSLVSSETNDDEVIDRLRALKLALYSSIEFDPEQFMKIVNSTRLFDDRKVLVERFAKGEVE
jgi:hypothetical protein